jgi:hypothetical protein
MAAHSSNIEEARDIRMLLQRLCRDGRPIRLQFSSFSGEFQLFAETEELVVVGVSNEVKEQWELKTGSHVLIALEDRGKKYETVVEISGFSRLEGAEACDFQHPRLLKCVNDERISDFKPDWPIPCTYTTRSLEIRDGKIRAFGSQGVELCYAGTDVTSEVLHLNEETILGLVLGKDERLSAASLVSHFGDGYAGLHFKGEGDPVYQAWLEDMLRLQAKRDQESFEAKGTRAARTQDAEAPRAAQTIRLLSDHDPMLVIVSEGDAFARRMAETLGKKYGLAHLDYIKGRVLPCLEVIGAGESDWGRARLLLVHQRLRVSSGLELTKDLVLDEKCPIPILVVGLEEDVPLKRNRAIAAGAIDFISVEPFHVIRVMKAIEDTLKMFS